VCIEGIFEEGKGVEFAEKGKGGAILGQSKGEIEEEECNGSAGSGGRLTNCVMVECMLQGSCTTATLVVEMQSVVFAHNQWEKGWQRRKIWS